MAINRQILQKHLCKIGCFFGYNIFIVTCAEGFAREYTLLFFMKVWYYTIRK